MTEVAKGSMESWPTMAYSMQYSMTDNGRCQQHPLAAWHWFFWFCLGYGTESRYRGDGIAGEITYEHTIDANVIEQGDWALSMLLQNQKMCRVPSILGIGVESGSCI